MITANLTANAIAHRAMYPLNDSDGVYAPQRFVKHNSMADWGVSPEDAAVLLSGPGHEDYWDTWDAVVQTAEWVRGDGHRHTLYCGEVFCDIFALDNTLIEEWESKTGRSFWDEYMP